MTERWTYDEGRGIIQDENGLKVATVIAIGKTRVDDGHLIAAAPEMREALERGYEALGHAFALLRDKGERPAIVENALPHMRAAIATAKGSGSAGTISQGSAEA